MIMVIASPLIGAVLGRLPDVTVHLAAYGAAQTMAILLESPIIMMLHAGNATARSRTAFSNLGRLMWLFNVAITVLYAAIAFTPAYGWVAQTALGLPPDVAAAARPAFGVLLLWPASIGYRRYWQGLLIRHGRSRWIMLAGFVRLGALTATLFIAAAAGLPGAFVASLALIASVMAEAAAVGLLARSLRRELAELEALETLAGSAGGPGHRGAGDAAHGAVPEGLASLFWWYLPLAGTQVLVWLARPMMTAGIARAGLAELSLAAWPVAWATVGVLSNGTRMVQQLTISLVRDGESDRAIRRFVLQVGLLFTGLLTALAFTPLAPVYLEQAIGLPAELMIVSRPVLMIAAAYPMLVAIQNWLQGLLVKSGRTGRINLAAFMGGVTAVGLVFAGALVWGMPGAPLAAAAAMIGICVEIVALWRFNRGGRGPLTACKVQ